MQTMKNKWNNPHRAGIGLNEMLRIKPAQLTSINSNCYSCQETTGIQLATQEVNQNYLEDLSIKSVHRKAYYLYLLVLISIQKHVEKF